MSARSEELKRRLEREPGSRLFAQYAEELRRDGDTAGAIKICREGLGRHPNYASARITLGRALLDTGDVAGARSEFETVLRQSPENILASRYLAECLERAGDLGAAMARYEATLAQSPGDEFSLERVAELRAAKSSTVEAPTAESAAVGAEDWVAMPEDGRVAGQTGGQEAVVVEEEEFELAPQRAAPGRPELTFRPLVEEAVPYQAEATATRPMSEAELARLTAAPAKVVEARAEGADEEPLVSATLAGLYRRQGAPERALEMYRELLSREPGNGAFSEAIAELEGELKARERPAPRARGARVVARLQALEAGLRRAAEAARSGS